jgi:uncharacterized protein YoaH (UPF0181 family)
MNKIDPELRLAVEQANELIASGMAAIDALEQVSKGMKIGKMALYQRIRLNGGRLEKQFVLPDDNEAAAVA